MKELYKNRFGDCCTIRKYKKNARISVFHDNSGFSFIVPIKEIIDYLTDNSNKTNKNSGKQ